MRLSVYERAAIGTIVDVALFTAAWKLLDWIFGCSTSLTMPLAILALFVANRARAEIADIRHAHAARRIFEAEPRA